MNGVNKPPTDKQPSVAITVSLQEIYDALCPSCRDAFLDLITSKAQTSVLRDGIRGQLEAKPNE